MARTRQQKEATVAQVSQLLAGSKVTVVAQYAGTPVREMQQLRASAKDSGTQIRVIKNRLFRKALSTVEELNRVDTSNLKGQLLYAFNDSDEAAAAQSLAAFAKTNPQIEFIGAITQEGQLLNTDDVKVLASLPSKQHLRAHLAAVINSPAAGLASVMAANIRGVANVLNSRSEVLSVK